MRLMVIPIATFALTAALRLTAAAQQATTVNPLRTEVPVALTGCAPVDEMPFGQFARSSAATVRSKRTGEGKILTRVGHGVPVAGRFVPTTNLAAQAGSLDQTFFTQAIAVGEQNRIPVPPHRAAVPHAIVQPPPNAGCPSR